MGTTGTTGTGPRWLDIICWRPMSKSGQQVKMRCDFDIKIFNDEYAYDKEEEPVVPVCDFP